ncbi:MAG: outer membrane beta-barrel protein [Geminicoccaceae bacterium]
MTNGKKLGVACLALAGVVCAPQMAGAQQQQSDNPDPNITIAQRPRPDYDPLGIRAGSFLIFPSISLSGTYDSNVFATEDDEDSDVGAILAPRVDVNSNWSRHALNFSAGAVGALWNDYSENDYLDAFAATNGRLDITRNDIASGTLRFDRLHEDRDDPDDSGTTSIGTSDRGNLTRYYRGLLDTQYRHNFNRIFTVVGGGVQRLLYDDIGDRENSRRDRWEYGGRARLGYQVSPRIGTFVQGNYSWREYDEDQNIDGELQKRDNHGWRAALGTTVDITSIVFGEASFGYSKRYYDADGLNNSGGFGANGNITWNVTPLTSLIFSASSEVLESTVTFEGDTAEGNLQNQVGVEVQHELLRNVLLNGTLGYTRDDFQGTSRNDNIYAAGFGASYLLNRNLSLNANYTFTKRDSDDDTAEFDRNIVLVGFTVRM